MRHRHGRPSAAVASSGHGPGSFLSSFHSNIHQQSFQHGGLDSCNFRLSGSQQQQQQV